jgi:hypothetical protein
VQLLVELVGSMEPLVEHKLAVVVKQTIIGLVVVEHKLVFVGQLVFVEQLVFIEQQVFVEQQVFIEQQVFVEQQLFELVSLVQLEPILVENIFSVKDLFVAWLQCKIFI